MWLDTTHRMKSKNKNDNIIKVKIKLLGLLMRCWSKSSIQRSRRSRNSTTSFWPADEGARTSKAPSSRAFLISWHSTRLTWLDCNVKQQLQIILLPLRLQLVTDLTATSNNNYTYYYYNSDDDKHEKADNNDWQNCCCYYYNTTTTSTTTVVVTCAAVKSFQLSTARVSFLYSSDVVSQVVNAQSHKLHHET